MADDGNDFTEDISEEEEQDFPLTADAYANDIPTIEVEDVGQDFPQGTDEYDSDIPTIEVEDIGQDFPQDADAYDNDIPTIEVDDVPLDTPGNPDYTYESQDEDNYDSDRGRGVRFQDYGQGRQSYDSQDDYYYPYDSMSPEDNDWDKMDVQALEKDGWSLHETLGEGNEFELLYERLPGEDYYESEEGEGEFDYPPNAVNFEPPKLSDGYLEFCEKYMHIPDEPAREKMSQAALEEGSLKDPIVMRLQQPETVEYVSTTEPRMFRCPSIESMFKLRRGVDVHFYLYPGGKMISKECRLDATIYQIKFAIGRYVKVPPPNLDIRKKKNLVSDEKTLAELGGRPQKKMKLTVEINKRLTGNFKIKLANEQENLEEVQEDSQMRVKIDTEDGGSYFVNVTVVHPTETKLKLGGFMDQRAGKTFHHAVTTMDETPRLLRETQVSTACQVFCTKDSTMQTLVNKSQQMERRGVYVCELNDREIRANVPYLDYEFYEMKRREAAITIQRYWRRWLAIRERRRREEGLIQRVRWAENIRKGRLEQRMAIMEQELQRQENPKRLVDLELLYRAINAWRREEEEYVNENRWGPERKAALATLADLESDLLLDLERTKNRINVQERENRCMKVFDKMGQPTRWLSEKTPNFITLDNRDKAKVRQLQDIYKSLLSPVQNTPEGAQKRTILLGQVNIITNSINSKMSQMLNKLVSRELTFLQMKDCSNALFAGVRKRIATTFYFLCQDPSFNKEATKVSKVPYDPLKLRKDMLQCKGCRRMQYRDEFTIIKGTTVTSRCHTCSSLYRTAILRVDLNLYRHMLKELRKDELAAGVVNSVTFVMDAHDLQFLVEQIWHGQSALSGIDNRYLLRLCRWRKDAPFSPWNCVLLTEEEATAHLQLENMQDAYKESFFHKVLVKQATAKSYFEGLSRIAVGLDARIQDNCKTNVAKKSRMAELKEKMRRKARFLAALGKT